MRTSRKKSSGSKVVPILLSLLATAILLGGVFYGGKYLWGDVMQKPFKTFKADAITTVPITRDFTQKDSPAAIMPEYIKDPQTITRIRLGASMNQAFSKTTPNGTETQNCTMQGWVAPSRLATGPQSESDRHNLIQQQLLPECNKLLAWVNERGSFLISRLDIVDRSGGIGVSKPEAIPMEFVTEEIGKPILEDAHNQGDTVELTGCVISAERQVDCKPSKAGKNSPFKPVEDVSNWLSEKHEDTKETSFYEAFYNIIDWLTVKGDGIPTNIKIVSDTIENSPETVSFYDLFKNGKLKDAKDFPALFDKVFTRKMKQLISNGFIDNPDTNTAGTLLAGKNITIVGPPYGKGLVRDRIEQSLAFAQYVFGKRMHANVVIRYR